MSDPEDPAAAKAALRRRAYALRRAAHEVQAVVASRVAGDALVALLDARGALGPGATVAGYRPIRTEIDPAPALDALHARGVRLAMPVVEGTGRPLSFRAWHPGTAEIEGAFGARIPADPTPARPTALIVPLVAFDAGCRRLGYGGGFYDRTLAGLRAGDPGLLAVGLAYAAQRFEALACEATDQTLDAVVTEAGVHRHGGVS